MCYIGVTLRKMIDNMKKDNKKIHLYSGHELNVVMLLQTLGVYDDRFPEYSSAVILELHEIQKKQYVKVLYIAFVLSSQLSLNIYFFFLVNLFTETFCVLCRYSIITAPRHKPIHFEFLVAMRCAL